MARAILTTLVMMAYSICITESKPFYSYSRRNSYATGIAPPNVLTSRLGLATTTLMQLTRHLPDPHEKDLNKTGLLKILGSNFDPKYMSVEPPNDSRKPAEPQHLTLRTSSIMDQETEAIPWKIQNMQFEIQRKENGRKRMLGKRASMKLRQWLWELSRCPVKYDWADLGVKFFPRYVKTGQCVKKICSFPDGMSCHPDAKKRLKMLIWICFNDSTTSCGWRPFTVGTLASCKCGCHKKQ